MLLSFLVITSPAHDILPIVWTDYTYDSEHGIAEGIQRRSVSFRRGTFQVTYVTLVPRGNETLRRDAMGNAISVVQLWIICVISQNWWPDVRCGDVMTRMLKSTWCAAGASFQEWSIALVGMPEVWPCDQRSDQIRGLEVIGEHPDPLLSISTLASTGGNV